MEGWLYGIVEKGKFINTLRYDVSTLCLVTQQDNEADNAACQFIQINAMDTLYKKNNERNIWSIAKIEYFSVCDQTLYQNIYLHFLLNNVKEDKVCWYYSSIAHVQISCVCQNQPSYLCVEEIDISKHNTPSNNDNESKEAFRFSFQTWEDCCSQWGTTLHIVKFHA